MTIAGHIEEKVEVPKDVKVTMDGAKITMKGGFGTVSKEFVHPIVKVKLESGHFVISCEMPKQRDKAVVGTFAAHLRNMIGGVTHGYEYDMRVVYSHFPIKAAVKGNKFIIENFLGEKAARHADIVGDVKVAVKGNEVTATGADLEAVSQTAANIERATKIKGFDPRVFQDGIYIVEKARRAK